MHLNLGICCSIPCLLHPSLGGHLQHSLAPALQRKQILGPHGDRPSHNCFLLLRFLSALIDLFFLLFFGVYKHSIKCLQPSLLL